MTKLSTLLTLIAWLVFSVAPNYALAENINPEDEKISVSVHDGRPAARPENRSDQGTEKRLPEKKSLPRAVISELNFDAGFVDQGQTVEHDFMVKNEGEGLLLIENVSPG